MKKIDKIEMLAKNVINKGDISFEELFKVICTLTQKEISQVCEKIYANRLETYAVVDKNKNVIDIIWA